MEQYLDEKDGKWHITMWVDIPNVVIRNKLNFRVHSSLSNDGSVIKDPDFTNSRYKFAIYQGLLGKRLFFNTSFDLTAINDIDTFTFGLCDEGVRWHNSLLFNVKNEFVPRCLESTPVIDESFKTMQSTIENTITEEELTDNVSATSEMPISTIISELPVSNLQGSNLATKSVFQKKQKKIK